MSDAHLDRSDLEERLWSEADKARFGMLGLTDTRQHMQPMTMFVDRAENAIWFFTRKGADLAQSTGAGHYAMLCIMAKDMEFQACIGGQLTPDHDPEKIDKYWSPNVAAWFPEGKDDPDLTLLKLTCNDAQIWVSHGGPLNYAFQTLKANATHTLPDVGQHGSVNLS